MQSFAKRCALVLATLTAATTALDGIVAPSQVEAGSEIEVTFQDSNEDQYRVYLAASLAGSNGPTCYLINSTELNDSVNVTIPPGVGPSANYYSIAIADLTTGQRATYSNRFNLTGANGEYSDYEDALGGSPFWSADDLPCSAYSCARDCAQASYPEDLTDVDAYNTMKQCILKCNGVTPATSQTAPAHASSTSAKASTLTGNMAVITASGTTLTAIETERVERGSTITEAIVGDMTITLNGAARTVASVGVSLATNGVEVGGSTTVEFSSTTATMGGPTATDAQLASESSGSAASNKFFAGAAAGFAGLAFFL